MTRTTYGYSTDADQLPRQRRDEPAVSPTVFRERGLRIYFDRWLLRTLSCCLVGSVLLSFSPAYSRADRACPKGETRIDEGCVRKPKLRRKAKPVYPKEALRQRLKGHVTLELTVMEDGSVADIEVKESTNPGHGFEEAAIAACEQWRYTPGTLNGKPAAMWLMVEVDFTYR